MTTTLDYSPYTATHAIVEPGGPLIDVLRPDGTTHFRRETIEQVRATRYPLAEVVEIETWLAERAEIQHRPIEWHATTPEEASRMRGEVFPAAFGPRGAFLAGEPFNHSYRTGAPMFAAYRPISFDSDGDAIEWQVANRAITKAEFIAEMDSFTLTHEGR